MEKLVLAADIGGTKSDLGLFDAHGDPNSPLAYSHFSSREAVGPHELINTFIEETGARPLLCVIGIAGTVVGDIARTPNLPWDIDRKNLERDLGGIPVILVNDLVATGYGLEVLPESAFRIINKGDEAPSGNRAIIAPGTGLGEALIFNDKGEKKVFPSEGGHSSFSPQNDDDIELLRFLWAKYGRVSIERVVSGTALVDLYDFELSRGGKSNSHKRVKEISLGEATVTIVREAIRGGDFACVAAVNIFIRHLGARAGDLALVNIATGGIFIGGGLSPKIAGLLESEHFIHPFTDKGRFSEMMRQIPVKVIMETKAPLYGAAKLGQIELKSLKL